MTPIAGFRLTLSRVILFCVDLGALQSFYVRNFGCTIREEINGEWVVLDCGGFELALHKVGKGYEPAPGEKFVVDGNSKLVFRLTGDLDSFRYRLQNEGIKIGEIKTFEGFSSRFCDGEDPEGNVFQIECPAQ